MNILYRYRNNSIHFILLMNICRCPGEGAGSAEDELAGGD
jgi:hypothetical protein